MSKLKMAFAFVTGAAIGGAAVWYALKDRYARLTDEEIASVKETYSQMEHKSMKDLGKQFADGIKESLDEEKTPAVTTKIQDKGNITEYAERIKNGAPMEYSKTVVPSKPSVPDDDSSQEESLNHVCVISPEEFSEDEEYTAVSLTYFADGILSDEHGVIIENIEDIIGDGLNHFGEYEDDSVFVRNDKTRCDYEILRDEREYAVYRATLPPNI